MVPFHWKKLPAPKIPGTVWTDIPKIVINGDNAPGWAEKHPQSEGNTLMSALDLAKVDVLTQRLQDVQDVFKLRQKVAKKKEKKSGEKTKVELIDGKRQTNLLIALNQFKTDGKQLTNQDIWTAIRETDGDKLNIDKLERLQSMMPMEGEAEMLSAPLPPGVDVKDLDLATQFLIGMTKIPLAKERVAAWLFYESSSGLLGPVMHNIELLSGAMKEVKDGVRMKGVFKILLDLGNYINAGTYRANAKGFYLETLGKVPETKGTLTGGEGTNLMRYIARMCEKEYHILLDFGCEEEWGKLRAACDVILSDCVNTTNDVKKQVAEHKKYVAKLKNIPSGTDDPFFLPLGKFLENMQKDVDKTFAEMEKLVPTFQALIDYFGEKMKPADIELEASTPDGKHAITTFLQVSFASPPSPNKTTRSDPLEINFLCLQEIVAFGDAFIEAGEQNKQADEERVKAVERKRKKAIRDKKEAELKAKRKAGKEAKALGSIIQVRLISVFRCAVNGLFCLMPTDVAGQAAARESSPRNMKGIDGLMARAKAKGIETDRSAGDGWD